MSLSPAQQVLQTYIMGRVGSPFRRSKISGLTGADLLFIGNFNGDDDVALILASWLSRLTEPKFHPWYVWVAELAREFASRGLVSDEGRFNGLSTLCTAPLRGGYPPAGDLDAAFESGVRSINPAEPVTSQGAAGVCAHLRSLAYGGEPSQTEAACDGLCVHSHPVISYRA